MSRDFNRSRMAEAALNNEALTRERVDRLEADLRNLREVSSDSWRGHEVILCRGFWGRLGWLLIGR